MNIIDEVKRARRVGVPLIGIMAADQPAVVSKLKEAFGDEAPTAKAKLPLILWDCHRGAIALCELGAHSLSHAGFDTQNPVTNLADVLEKALKLDDKSIVIALNVQHFISDPFVIQGLMNMRDLFAGTKKTLIMLAPDLKPPPEIAQDILLIDEPLPNDEAITAILSDLYSRNKVTVEDELLERSKAALRGLAAFPIEQAAALSVRTEETPLRVDVSDMWNRKRLMIRQVRGLSMEPARETFDDIGGLEQWKTYARGLFAGKRPPVLIAWLDEIEKSVAGASDRGPGDTSGTSQDQLGTLLTEMEERDLPGALFLGPGGSGKSLAAKATAATFGIPLIRVDLGAAKGSLVGQSEAQIRALMKAIVAAGGEGNVLFIATCNGIDNLTAALRRRLARRGMWFYDLPDEAERVSIAAIQCKRYGLKDKDGFFKRAAGWSGANIRDCCDQANAMNLSIEEASKYVVPASQQDQGLERLRQMAAGKFLSASYPGPYKAPESLMENAQGQVKRVIVAAEMEVPAEVANKPDGKGN